MRDPLPISTLAEAAVWLTEATGAAWTDKEVLGTIFKKMIPIAIDQEPLENYLHISLPKSARLSFRRFDPETGTIKSRLCEGWEMPALSRYDDALSLITHGAIDFPYPLISEQWEGEDGFCIGADAPPIVTLESLRINAKDLAELGDVLKAQVESQNNTQTSMQSKYKEPLPTPAPLHPINAEPVQASPRIKKAALVTKYRLEWPTANNDFADASRNELGDTRLAPGFYDETKAVQWAKERGKFNEGNPTRPPLISIYDSPTSVKRRSE